MAWRTKQHRCQYCGQECGILKNLLDHKPECSERTKKLKQLKNYKIANGHIRVLLAKVQVSGMIQCV